MPKPKTSRSATDYLQAAMEAQRAGQAQLAKMLSGAMGGGASKVVAQARAPVDPQLERLTRAYERCNKRSQRLLVQVAEGLAKGSKER